MLAGMPAQISQYLRRFLWISGRSGRAEWWLIEILVLASYWLHDTCVRVLRFLGVEDGVTGGLILVALAVGLYWVNMASSIRRLHDRNKSGWWALLFLPPILGTAWQIIECGFLKGREAGARFDPVPEPDRAEMAQRIVVRARAPSKLLMAITAVFAMGLLASTCMTVRVSEVGPNDRLPGWTPKGPDERG
jgi:uncharacterized membrane protein YhaH (DUF805 family)